VISSAKVLWKKQGTCKLLDDEPPSPQQEKYKSSKGWKEVSGLTATQGGGDFLFPMDQLLLVTADGYKPIKEDKKRVLSALNKEKNYLVWYHHVMTTATWQAKFKERQEKDSKRQKKS
jgi:hypothetical protein